MLSVMRRYRDNRNHSSIRSIIPENPVSTRCFLLGICLEDLFPLRPFERSKFAGVQRRMAEVGFKKPKTFPDGLEDSLFRRLFSISRRSVSARASLMLLELRTCWVRYSMPFGEFFIENGCNWYLSKL